MLLRNRDNFLPLDRNAVKTIAVIGPFADFAQTGPNYTGLYSTFVKPLDGIRKKVGPATKVLYARGSGILESDNPEAGYTEAVGLAKQADVCVLFVGINEILEREGIDRNFINLPPVQTQLVRRVLEANPRTVVVLQNGGPLSLVGGAGPGGGQRPDAPAILDMFWAGEEGGTAIADVLFGDYNPGGRLPYTVYQSVQDIPPMKEYDITRGFTYMYFDGEVDWAFGHGLSYTTFEYSNLKVAGTVPGRSADGHGRCSEQRQENGRRGRPALCPRRRSQREATEEAVDGVRTHHSRCGRYSHRQLHGLAGTAGVLGREAEGVDGGARRVRGDGRQFVGRCATEG